MKVITSSTIGVGLILLAFGWLLTKPATALNATLNDAGLMALDWCYNNPPDTPYIAATRNVAGPGVEFDIYYPGNESPDHSITYVSCVCGGNGSLTGIDVSMYDAYQLGFTILSVSGSSSPDAGGPLIVGALIDRDSGWAYQPQTIGLGESQEPTAVSSTTISVTGPTSIIGFRAHIPYWWWSSSDNPWDPSGSLVTLLVEPVAGAVAIPEPAAFLLATLGTTILLGRRRR